MIFAQPLTGHERAVIGRLHLLGLDGERVVAPRHSFRAELRDRLVAEAAGRSAAHSAA
jgi:hypothetical protein